MVTDNTIRARVFISCGQTKNTGESQTAHAIAERLTQLGYDPYIATEEQTLRGLKENIFHQLETSEYFIFIDFKRERLDIPDVLLYRGSLFSHQELVLASYLDMNLIAFQEAGVKKDDGIIGYLQANSIEFTDRHLLPAVIADEILKRGWNPLWQSKLVLVRNPAEHSDATCLHEWFRAGDSVKSLQPARFFHAEVRNIHHHKTARNC